MHRLFVAIRPPHAIRSQLLGLMGGVRGARWQDDDQLHITLRFIGEVNVNQAEDIAAALSTVRAASFEAALAGVGCFGHKGRPATIWAGVAPREALVALHKKVDHAVTRVGLEPERRAYAPHVTLARMKRDGGPVDAFVNGHAGLCSAPFIVSHFALFESSLGPDGADYTLVARYPLG